MTTHDMTKKKPRRSDSTESSSSEEMEPSKPPKDVLGLGRYLVRELKFEDGVDTLGRWMAHHLAELIDAAENGETAAERLQARTRAMETILKVWEHRTSLPGNAYPLAPYKDVLQVLDRLRPDHNPFRYFSHYAKRTKEQLAAELFDGLARLIITLLLMKMPAGKESATVDEAAIEALSGTEQHVLTALQQWGELFASTSRSSGRTRKSKRRGDDGKVNLDEAAVRSIDSITTILVELRSELQEADRQPVDH